MCAAADAFWQQDGGNRAIAQILGIEDLAMTGVVHHIHCESDEVAIVFTGATRSRRKHSFTGVHAGRQVVVLFGAGHHVVFDETFKSEPTVSRNHAVHGVVLLASNLRVNHSELGDGV